MKKQPKFNISALEYYVVGGVDEICDLISKINLVGNNQLIKKQFEKKNLIVINNLSDLMFDGWEEVIISLTMEVLTYYDYETVKSKFISDSLPFGELSHYNSDIQIAANKMIQLSLFEDSEKEEILDTLKKFKIEIYSTEEIFRVYQDSDNYELYNLISYIKDDNEEMELRLTVLSKFMIKLNKAIYKNEEIIKRKSYQHKKDCATTINNTLKEILGTIKSELNQYLLSLGNTYQNIAEDREPREFLLYSLIESKQKVDLFLEYEKQLVEKRYLSKDFSQWLKSPILLVKFYKYCEMNKIFRYNFNKKTKGVKLMRDLYNFQDGKSIDKPTKRDKYIKEVKHDYFFLNSIRVI